jgi:hypothetical protein
MVIAAILLLIIIAAIFFERNSPFGGSIDPNATTKAYVDMKNSWDFSQQMPERLDGDYDSFASQSELVSAQCKNDSYNLRHISTAGVDSKVKDLINKSADYFDLYASYADKEAAFAMNVKETVDKYQSNGELIKGLLEIAMGDFFSEYNAANDAEDKLKHQR